MNEFSDEAVQSLSEAFVKSLFVLLPQIEEEKMYNNALNELDNFSVFV